MNPATDVAIDIVEAAYDLEQQPGDWLPNLVHAVSQAMDVDVGVYGQLYGGVSEDGQPMTSQLCAEWGLPDYYNRLGRAAQEAGPELIAASSQSLVSTVVVTSEWKNQWPAAAKALTKHFECEDMLAICAMDPDYHGAMVAGHTNGTIVLSPAARRHWHMLGVHIAAGARLQAHFTDLGAGAVPPTDLPLNAEALVDPKNFIIAEAALEAKDRAASEIIRGAAQRVDRARGKLRTTDPHGALEMWKGLVNGRWSLVDWFDTDGRRFVLAKPNAPDIGDPRGLTEREHQVVTYTSYGESSKMISYRFGISQPGVSKSLRSAMKKLGVQTRPQLVEKLRGLPLAEPEKA